MSSITRSSSARERVGLEKGASLERGVYGMTATVGAMPGEYAFFVPSMTGVRGY